MASSSSPNRNTLNQRASRERRREYIQDLERRVREYETQGVHATAELQGAARQVADENRSLRTEIQLLREKCTTLEMEISNFKHDGIGNSTGIGAHTAGMDKRRRRSGKSMGRRSRGNSAFKEVTAALGSNADFSSPADSHQENQDKHMRSTTTSPTLESHSPTSSGFGSHAILAPAVEARNGSTRLDAEIETDTSPWHSEPTPDTNDDLPMAESYFYPHLPQEASLTSALHYPSPPLSSTTNAAATCSPLSAAPNSTPCLRAALIIAGMRGVPEYDEATLETEILLELGCVGPLKRPICRPSEKDCASHGPRVADAGRISVGGGERRMVLAETADCAVDNGRLFGILARDSYIEGGT